MMSRGCSPAGLRAAALGHGDDLRTGGQVVGRGDLTVEILQRHAEIGAAQDPAVALQVVDHAHDVVDRDGEAEPLDGHAGFRRTGDLGRRHAR